MKKIIFVLLTIYSTGIYAGTSDHGTISVIEFIGDGRILFRHSGIHTNPPGCVGQNFMNRWAIDARTEGGKIQLSGLLMAYASGKKIRIIGKGNCLTWGDSESVNYFYTE